MLDSESAIVQAAIALGAPEVGGPLDAAELALIERSSDEPALPPEHVSQLHAAIRNGDDPLGEAFCQVRDAATRRVNGAIFSPPELVDPMVEWVLQQEPDNIVDAGSGSGRFVAQLIRRRASSKVVAVDLDPLSTLMTRSVVAVLKAPHARVVLGDYTRLVFPKHAGSTAFIGNPPYVRHHKLSSNAKAWAQETAGVLGHRISGLAGLHAHFFLATASYAQPGDIGCFVTSAEWLDVNYGAVIRSLVLDDLGGQSLHVVEPKALPFEGTQTTAVITTFRVGRSAPTVRIQGVEAVDELKDLATSGYPVSRARLQETPRWSGLLRAAAKVPEGFIELGEICRVHRGAVTGANATWVLNHRGDLPESVLFASVTKARELFAAGDVLTDRARLRLVVDIPKDLNQIDPSELGKVERFIKAAKQAGVHKGYIAAHRRAWWSIGLKDPAPILATYMARRSPAFVVNTVQARHINIAHGLYPRQDLSPHVLARLAAALRTGATLDRGRVYAGGLTKFEPKEMERLMVPDLVTLTSHEPLPASMDFGRV